MRFIQTGRPSGNLAVACGLAAGVALLGLAPSAQAAGDFGGAVFFTARDCVGLTATQACAVPGQPFVYREYAGGAGQPVNYYDSSPQGDFVQSQISFGDNAFPQIKQSDAAVSNYRVNVNAFAWNGFTNSSDSAVELSYAGNLHIVNSSGNPLGGNPEWAGGSAYFSYVAIWDRSLISGIVSAQDVFDSGINRNDCTTPGVLGYGAASGPLAGGEQSIHMTTVSCSGSPIMVGAHQEVLAVGFLQTPVNRGGFVDASHTFTLGYDPALSADSIQTLERVMTPDAPAGLGVPEPATWALMISGFGMAGAALRRRRALAVV